MTTVPYPVEMQDDEIRAPDRISWERDRDGVRVFGHVKDVRGGWILAISDRGVHVPLRRGRVTKECR